MELRSILRVIKQCFHCLPEQDNRANVGPLEFVAALTVSLAKDGRNRTLATIRRNVSTLTGINFDRGSFWERLATKRLLELLTSLVVHLMVALGRKCGVTNGLLAVLKVKAIFVLDSTSSTLPKKAKNYFPAPRKNVVPAAIKFHALYDLFGATLSWFDLTAATTHDRKGFPPLELLKNSLIIFDLGYWDYCLLAALKDSGAYFLSRVKSNASITIVNVIEGLPKKKFRGKDLFSCRLPSPKKKIIEVIGEFRHYGNVILHARVIGFWNPIEKRYHWYVTNLSVAASIIYPLYRIRWQLELVFKACKSSLSLADQPSANENIIKNLTLISLAAQLLGFSIGKKATARMDEQKQNAFSFQRAAMLLIHIGADFFRFLTSDAEEQLQQLLRQIKLLSEELLDPNYQHRPTSLQQVFSAANA